MPMRAGIRFTPSDTPDAAASDDQMVVEGIPVFYEPTFNQLGRARGFWPFRKKIVVGTKLWGLDWRARIGVLYHEAHHCNAYHKEKRIAVFALAVLLSPILFPIIPALFRRIAHTQEFEADQFAKSKGYGLDLARALMTYPEGRRKDDVLFHPSLAERCRRLKEAP